MMGENISVLIFDLWGDYAHFRRPETTSSPLTYSFPPITVLSGLVGAIVGLNKNQWQEYFRPDKSRFAVTMLKPLKKINLGINIIKTDEGFFLWDIKKNPRSPTPFEFIKDPYYRIYFWTQERYLYSDLKKFLQNHQSFYTPYLGISENLANFAFIGEYKGHKHYSSDHNLVWIDTVLPSGSGKLKIEKDKIYIKEVVPFWMDNQRIPRAYVEVFIEPKGKSICASEVEWYDINQKKVVFIYQNDFST